MITGKGISAIAAVAVAALVAFTTVNYRVSAGTPVYKCMKNGQVTFTDKPCEGNADPDQGGTPTMVPSSKNPTPVGTWSGQIQYQEAQNAQTIQAAHSVAPLKAEFTSDGRVTGLSEGNRCKWLGVWSDGGQTLIWIDVTLSDCAYGEMNRRYHGSFILARPDSSGQITAQSLGVAFSKDVGKVFDLKGTLRR